ncbi:hypothetical protein DQ403_13200 [Stutzerimonas zhaodongensis]|uniref:Uncharacterized protein n=1 Tax=Stutzerimonas zhaodongensis TaxID=1176257 RepID=A0A365PTA2_9GAMM|nr:hypothetical protein [Stutzerimonas zhaodongensis]RBA56867.1 hypothetical protein DQ403_13200 [Stutzerimonas zhaodongensis]
MFGWLLPAAFIMYDPMQLFHEAWGRPATFHSNMRQQAAGIIRHYPFDSVILGTSMLENQSADAAGRALGGRFVNISISGSLHAERSPVLAFALRERPLSTVIYSIDEIEPRDENPDVALGTFDYLYNRIQADDLRAYFNDRFYPCLIRWSASPECVGDAVSLDRPNAWIRFPEHAARFGGLQNWFTARNDPQIQGAFRLIIESAAKAGHQPDPDEAELANARQRIIEYSNQYILDHARRNPATTFHFVFPPYSRAKFAILHQSEPIRARQHEATLRHFAEAATQLENVQVYAFEDQDFLDDIANYKDLSHYSPDINDLIVERIRQGKNNLDAQNVERYIDTARTQALRFDLVGFGARLEEYLANQ